MDEDARTATGKILRELRDESGLSLRALGAAADGVHWSLISHVERGTRSLSPAVAKALDGALHTGGVLYDIVSGGPDMAELPKIIRVAPDRYATDPERAVFAVEAEAAYPDVVYTAEASLRIANAYIAERVGCYAGEMAREVIYTGKSGDLVLLNSYAWEHAETIYNTEIEDPHAGPYAGRNAITRYAALGITIDALEEQVIARHPADEREMKLFGVTPTTILIEVRQTFLAGTVAYLAADLIYRADAYELHYRMPLGLPTLPVRPIVDRSPVESTN